MLIKLVEIHKIYRANNIGFHALKGINLELDRGEFVAIVGPSGCGKTTLLNIIGGLDEPSSGDMVIDGKITTKFRDDEWDYFRNHKIGFVFQQYNLLDNLNIVENVALAAKLQGIPHEECMQKAKDILVRFGLVDHLHKTPKKLSGGQRQRVAIARALINDPDIIMADEPTGALDSKTSDDVMGLIKSISENKLVIVVTHNKKIATKYADRLIKLEDGNIISDTKEPAIQTEKVKVQIKPNLAKTKFSFMQSFKMAGKNIFNRKWRTLLIALGLSIGITGLLAIDTVGSGVRREIDAEQNQYLTSPEIFISVEDLANQYYNPLPVEDIKPTYNKIKQLVPEIDEIYQHKNTVFLVSGIPQSEMQEYDAHTAYNFKIVPEKIEYLGRGQDLVEDGVMPTTSTEVVISQSIAKAITKQFSIPVETIWESLKNKTIYIADELKPDFNYNPQILDIRNNCTTYYDYSDLDANKYGTEEQNSAWLLDIFGVTRLYSQQFYQQIACTQDVYLNTEYHIKTDLSKQGWFSNTKALNYKEFTIVGIMKNHLGSDLYFTEEGVNHFNGKTFTFTSNDFVAYLYKNQINQKTSIITRLETSGIAVKEVGNTNGEWQIIIKIITHIIQFGISVIVSIAVVTAVIMLTMVLYISILERKREIGLLRSLGATKSDIKRIFVSETAIIGLLAGLLSIGFTLLLVAIGEPIIYEHFGDIIRDAFPYNDGSFLYLKVSSAINAVIGSIVIAILGGLIPASKAAKKPPIDALRR